MKTNGSIDDIESNIGFGCEVMVQFKGAGNRIKSSLIGIAPKSYLIIETPKIVGIHHCLKEDTLVIIRYLYLGKVFGFQSSVLGHVSAPRQLIFLSYPIRVEQINLRKHERITCTIPVKFGFSAFDFKGMISDLSCGGCRINSKIGQGNHTADLFQVGDTIALSFPQLGMESNVNLNGIIRNINHKDTLIIFGVQFDDTHTEAIDKINSYISMVNNVTIDD